MEKEERAGYMEFTGTPAKFKPTADLRRLVEAVEATQIRTFGWPIGAVLRDHAEYGPRPRKEGIRAEINRLDAPEGSPLGGYDYWSLGRDGTFYILKSLFEDRRSVSPRVVFVDTRVVRTAEVFLRTARLYEALGAPAEEIIGCRIEYGGLRGRTLAFANPRRLPLLNPPTSEEDSVEKTFELTLGQYLDPSELKRVVHDVVKGITELFGFFVLSKEVTDQIVDAFLQGRVL